MGTYCTTAQVAARLPYRTIDSSSKPTSTQVGEWIDEAEALVTAALNAIEVSTPITGDDGFRILRSIVLDYAVGHVRMAYAAAGGDADNDAGADEIERFNERVSDFFAHPTRWASMLSGGSASSNQRHLRGYQVDNDDNKSVDNGDFTPSFTRSESF